MPNTLTPTTVPATPTLRIVAPGGPPTLGFAALVEAVTPRVSATQASPAAGPTGPAIPQPTAVASAPDLKGMSPPVSATPASPAAGPRGPAIPQPPAVASAPDLTGVSPPVSATRASPAAGPTGPAIPQPPAVASAPDLTDVSPPVSATPAVPTTPAIPQPPMLAGAPDLKGVTVAPKAGKVAQADPKTAKAGRAVPRQAAAVPGTHHTAPVMPALDTLLAVALPIAIPLVAMGEVAPTAIPSNAKPMPQGLAASPALTALAPVGAPVLAQTAVPIPAPAGVPTPALPAAVDARAVTTPGLTALVGIRRRLRRNSPPLRSPGPPRPARCGARQWATVPSRPQSQPRLPPPWSRWSTPPGCATSRCS